jgi:hypothetical protein
MSLPAAAQSAPDTETTTLTAVTPPSTPAPLVINWNFFGGVGKANMTINPDGTWMFSGQYNGNKPNKDIDVAFSLTAKTGGTLFFRYVGSAANGAQWSKQGRSGILQDNFAQFVGAGPDNWAGTYRFTESAAGKKAEYEAWEKKRQEAEAKREEARKAYEDGLKRKDAKIQQLKDELDRQKRDEQAQAQAEANSEKSSSGGGSSVGSTIGKIASVAGPILGTVLSFL